MRILKYVSDSLFGLIRSYSQDETSELFIGEWAEKRGIRDQLVIATKAGIYPTILLTILIRALISIRRTSSAVSKIPPFMLTMPATTPSQ